jgi:hypothetical protein
MFTPGPAIFYLATILRPDHVCGVQWSRVWRKSRFSNILPVGGSTLCLGAERRLSSPSLSPSRRQGNMDRASQVLAQGVPPGVPESYRALADYGNVPRSTLHHRARGRPSIEAKAQGQQYLELYEEDVVVKYLLRTRTALSEGFGCKTKG